MAQHVGTYRADVVTRSDLFAFSWGLLIKSVPLGLKLTVIPFLPHVNHRNRSVLPAQLISSWTNLAGFITQVVPSILRND